MTWHLLIFITSIHVTWLSWLDKWFFLLVFSWWKFCALVPHRIDLCSLWVTIHLFWCVWQLPLNFPSSLQAAWSCLLGYFLNPHYHQLWSLTQTLHHARRTKIYHNVGILAVSGGIFSKIDLCLHCIVPLIYTSASLSKACEKFKVSSHLIQLWLSELFKFSPDCI